MVLSPETAQILIAISLALIVFSAFAPMRAVTVYLATRTWLQHVATLQYTIAGTVPIFSPYAALMPFLAMVSLLANRGAGLFSAAMAPFQLLLGLSCLSTLTSMDLSTSLSSLTKVAFAYCIYILAYNGVRDEAGAARAMRQSVLVSLVPAGFALYQWVTGEVFSYSDMRWVTGLRIVGTLTDPNSFGIYMSLTFFMALGLFLMNRTKPGFALAALTLALVVLSKNRGTWIALMLATLVGGLAYKRRLSLSRLIAAYAVVGMLATPFILARFSELEGKDTWGQSQDTFSSRLQYSAMLLEASLDSPILGHGIGSSEIMAEEVVRTKVLPHNDYVRLAFETGYISVLLYVVFLLREILRARRHWDSPHWPFHYMYLLSITYFAVVSLAQNLLMDLLLYPYFMVGMAISHKLERLEREAQTTPWHAGPEGG